MGTGEKGVKEGEEEWRGVKSFLLISPNSAFSLVTSRDNNKIYKNGFRRNGEETLHPSSPLFTLLYTLPSCAYYGCIHYIHLDLKKSC